MSSTPYQLMPDLSDADYQALKADIAERGVLVPIELDEKGQILDGHHRLRAWRELRAAGVAVPEYDSIVRPGLTEAQKRNHVRALNLLRRHLSKDVLKAQMIQMRQDGMTLQAIAEAAGVTAKTVSNQIADAPELCKSTKLAGKDGKKRPTKYKRRKLVDGRSTAKHEERRQVVEERQQAEAEVIRDNKWAPVISLSDYASWLAAQPLCDLLLTDPPYSTDVDDIRAFAAEWLPLALGKLKSTGRAYVFVGAYPAELSAYLSVRQPDQILVWTYRNTLGPSPLLDYKLNWQAILYYRMPDAPPLDAPVMLEQFSVQDISAPDGRHFNRFYRWQKPDEIGERFTRHSTMPGALVLDPFAGSGSFLLAASRLGRQARGCDFSQEAIDIAITRGCTLG